MILPECLEYYKKLPGCRQKELRMMLRLYSSAKNSGAKSGELDRILKYSRVVVRTANPTYRFAKKEYGITLIEKKYLEPNSYRKPLDDLSIEKWVKILTNY